MLKRILSAFVSLIGVSLFITCRNRSLPEAANGKSLLWEISGKDLPQPSYFLGTMHLMCAEDALLSPNVLYLIKHSDKIYLEVDMDNASELLQALLDMSSKSGKTLESTLSPEEYERVKSFFEKYSNAASFSVLEQQPPLFITSSLYELLLPCEQKNGVEMKIIDEAYKAKKETKGLETLAFQASIFDSIPYEEQAVELVKTIDSLEKYRQNMQELLSVYKEQDVEKLFALTTAEDSTATQYMDLLLFDRNRNWVKQFPGIAKNASVLFAVGAGHLGGEKGVLQLLRQQGYTVKPVVN